MSIEKENCWRYESNVKILDINLNFIGIDIYKCYTCKFGHLPSRFRKLHREKQIEFIHFIIYRINKNSDREREREREREVAYNVVKLKANRIRSMAEAEDKDLVDGVSDDCVHRLFLCQHRQWVTTHSPHFQILGLICYVVISILRPKIIYKKEKSKLQLTWDLAWI